MNELVKQALLRKLSFAPMLGMANMAMGKTGDHYPELIVPAGCLFVLNDQRGRGADRMDSRAFGPISARSVGMGGGGSGLGGIAGRISGAMGMGQR